ncbi:MAG: ASPIC/UnbV domain-containing protein, partial [Cyclobacteriaceae bacterium]|nr:ASPIC/UnbV domain-containing protein [Cyclobacteriaceae bacterium]
SDVSYLLPEHITNGRQIALADYNQDGDLDIFLVGIDGGIKLLRNDGGNANHHLKIQLVGLRTGSGKNNYFGIGATVEVRAGDLYQMKAITEPGLHFGLGQREKADVVRILWTNGVPQNIFSPGSDQDLIETQELKGSCPFLYTWNGEEYVFVKDMMWRSALGMPLGIMGGKKAYAFADASEEYLKIPGELLHEKNGKYTIQMTEELWETIYCDEIKLIAVDHPEDVEIYVDEKFAAPPYAELKIYKVKNHQIPISVKDGKGNELQELIGKKDHQYISNFQRAKYQGITEMKDLILDLGNVQNTKDLYLFMNGWIFPTDASINVALSQSDVLKIKHPSLEVINEKGEWEEVIPSIGFPSGKNKTLIVDLSDKFLSSERKLRIRTNMEIYWDYIFFAKDEAIETELTNMHPESADYHYRGFSKEFRKGGRYGPYWFDYREVSIGQKWRDLTGTYTRYGDVTELLQEADDMYIIANAGDETTISFDAAKLPKLHEGWKRDFLIYSVGWVKDGDLNTALGQTVEPLPFHGMSQYP